MFFSNYPYHPIKKIRSSLLWEYSEEEINYKSMKLIIVQRVIERGGMDDFYAILNIYGLDEVKNAIKLIPTMSSKDIAFVSIIFGIKKSELKCYSKKRLTQQHWHS